LMIAELLQALGGLLNIKWVVDGKVTEGYHCTAQGVLKQMGNLGIAFISLLIAIHTFRILVLEVSLPHWVGGVSVGVVWVVVCLIISIPSATYEPPYYGNTGLWCWINTRKYPYAGITLEYAWMWFAAFVMLVLYLVVALSLRGVIGKRKGVGLPKDSALARRWRSLAVSMLFYPAVYIICIFPISIVRWLRFQSNIQVSDGATITAAIIFASSGMLNVILYLTTRPNLIRRSRKIVTTHIESGLGSKSSQLDGAVPSSPATPPSGKTVTTYDGEKNGFPSHTHQHSDHVQGHIHSSSVATLASSAYVPPSPGGPPPQVPPKTF